MRATYFSFRFGLVKDSSKSWAAVDRMIRSAAIQAISSEVRTRVLRISTGGSALWTRIVIIRIAWCYRYFVNPPSVSRNFHKPIRMTFYWIRMCRSMFCYGLFHPRRDSRIVWSLVRVCFGISQRYRVATIPTWSGVRRKRQDVYYLTFASSFAFALTFRPYSIPVLNRRLQRRV